MCTLLDNDGSIMCAVDYFSTFLDSIEKHSIMVMRRGLDTCHYGQEVAGQRKRRTVILKRYVIQDSNSFQSELFPHKHDLV